jgi:SAM-dependent methyltransferase
MFRERVTGLVSLQVANDPGGDRWTRLQDDAFDMFFAYHAGGPRRAAPPAGEIEGAGNDHHQQQPPASTADAFDQSHQGRLRSAMVEQIYRSAFGADYPAGAQPSTFYSATTLQLAVDALRLRPGHVLADLGCGHGGAGLWAARQTGAALIGIDLSPAGIELARHRAAQLGLDRQARFLVGDMAATGLPDASCDAVMSLDVLPFVPAKAAAAGEIARILRPGGRLAFTTWERLVHPAGYDPQRRALAGTFHAHPLLESARADYRQLISQAGLTVETYQEPPGWRAQQQALAEGIIAAAAEVTADMGRHYPAMARVFLASLPDSRYVFVAAASRQIRPDRKENRRTGDTNRRPPAHCRRALPRLEVPQLKPACQGQGAGRHATGTPGYLGSAAGIPG